MGTYFLFITVFLMTIAVFAVDLHQKRQQSLTKR